MKYKDPVEIQPVPTKPERRRDLDLMRMFVVVGLVFFHSARIFDTSFEWYVKNDPTSEFVTGALAFAGMWGMPLLFVISGMGIWYSLHSRTVGAFARERVNRLLIPLIFGVLVIVPSQIWTRLRADPAYDESYWQFLPRFFDVRFDLARFPFVIRDDSTGLFEVGHLWFVVVLFAFSLLLLPVIWWLRKPAGLRLIDRLAHRSEHFWMIVAAGLPFAVLDTAFGSDVDLAGWSRYSYAVFILYGYLLVTDRRFGRALRRHRKRALVLGIVTFIVVGTLFAIGSETEGVDPAVDFDAASLAMRAVKGISGWLWIVAIMGFAGGSRKRGRAPRESERRPTILDRVTAYTSEAVLPVYVLHQTVIVLLGFYIVQWPISATLKYLIICLVSLAVILAIYDVAVRRTRPTRFLFGMKPPPRELPRSAPLASRQPPTSN